MVTGTGSYKRRKTGPEVSFEVTLLPCKQFICVAVDVFLGTHMSLVDLMNTMQTAQLFENGEYMVIYVDMDTYSDKQAHKYLWSEYFSLTNASL